MGPMFPNYHGFMLLIAGMASVLSCSTPQQGQARENKAVTITASRPADTTKTDQFLESLMRQYPRYFDSVLANRSAWNVQVIYTQVDRGANGIPALRHHYFNVNPARYFYPASTVKLPIVLLALQKLNELRQTGIDRNTTMITETAYSGQTSVYNDPTSPNGTPSIGQYIKKILMVSDNDAYNRLYEFLGQEYINAELHKKGFADAQVLHRLDVFLTEEENRRTNPILFTDSSGTILYRVPAQRNGAVYATRTDSLGNAFYRRGQLVNGPMDFSRKNRLSLEDLHTLLLGVIFPEKVPAANRFNIREEDRQFVLKYMSQYPTESLYPPYAYDTASYWPAYCKFILFGGAKGAVPPHLRIFNKVGDAYGHMLDVAYVADFKNKIEFFVSAVIYCNSDGVLNDDRYDYKTIGLPFMQHLGEVLYEYELKRERRIKPDLSPVAFTYDK